MNEVDSLNQIIDNFVEDLDENNSISQSGKNGYLQNYEALKYLKNKQSQLNDIIRVGANPDEASILSIPLPAIAGATTASIVKNLFIPIDRLVSVMELLLLELENEGIIITPRVKTNEGIIDLLIRTSDRKCFAFMLRSNGNSLVKWREDRQEVVVSTHKKGGGGRLTRWSGLDLLSLQLTKMVLSLKKEKNPLVGLSSAERKQGFVKGIVLTSKTRLSSQNDPALIVEFGRTTALRVQKDSIFYIINWGNLADFLRDPKK
jgi:hypothetical protein